MSILVRNEPNKMRRRKSIQNLPLSCPYVSAGLKICPKSAILDARCSEPTHSTAAANVAFDRALFEPASIQRFVLCPVPVSRNSMPKFVLSEFPGPLTATLLLSVLEENEKLDQQWHSYYKLHEAETSPSGAQGD